MGGGNCVMLMHQKKFIALILLPLSLALYWLIKVINMKKLWWTVCQQCSALMMLHTHAYAYVTWVTAHRSTNEPGDKCNWSKISWPLKALQSTVNKKHWMCFHIRRNNGLKSYFQFKCNIFLRSIGCQAECCVINKFSIDATNLFQIQHIPLDSLSSSSHKIYSILM